MPRELDGYYDQYYGPGELSVSAFVQARLAALVGTFSGFRQLNRMLDVGIGAGALLVAAREAGWEAVGLEVSEPAVAHARGLGFEVHKSDPTSAPLRSETFDVITAIEVIEHVPDPRQFLSALLRLVRPGGVLWLTTPNGNGLSSRLLGIDWSSVIPPNHLQLFSHRGMTLLLRELGCSVMTVFSTGVNPLELLARSRHPSPSTQSGKPALSSVELNRRIEQTLVGRSGRSIANALLSALRLGDTLKIKVVKPRGAS